MAETEDGGRGATTLVIRGVGNAVVRDVGKGEPLLFLHGGEGPAADDFLEALLPSRVVAPDLPGIGETPLPDEWDEVADMADFAADVLDELGVERADVLGHSFGAYVAAELATRAPRRINHLVLSAPIGIQVPDAHIPPSSLIDPQALTHMLGYPSTGGPTPLRLRERETLSRFLFAAPFDRRLRRRLVRVRRPALVIRGSEDQIVPAGLARAFAEGLSGEYEELVGLPHALPHLAPDALAKAVRRFLNRDDQE